MSDNAMFVDYWEEFNTKRVEFRKLIKKVIVEAFLEGVWMNDNEISSVAAEKYAEEKIKELF